IFVRQLFRRPRSAAVRNVPDAARCRLAAALTMPGVVIHAAWSPGEVRVAAMAGGTLVDYAVWRPGSPDGVGDVHLGRVSAAMPAMAGVFVTLSMRDGATP